MKKTEEEEKRELLHPPLLAGTASRGGAGTRESRADVRRGEGGKGKRGRGKGMVKKGRVSTISHLC